MWFFRKNRSWYDCNVINELDELSEPYVTHRASTKKTYFFLAASKIVRTNSGLTLGGLVTDFEWASDSWHLEWVAIPESFISTVGPFHQMKFALNGLEVKNRFNVA